MLQLHKSGRRQQCLPRREVVIRPIPGPVPAFQVFTARVGTEQHAARLQRTLQLLEHPWQLLLGNMEQHRVGKHPVEAFGRQVQLEKVLQQHFTATVLAGHLRKPFGAIEPDGNMAHACKRLQITPRPAAEIQHGKRRCALDMAQQRVDVLAHIVIAGAFTEVLGHLVVVAEGDGSDLVEVVGLEGHGGKYRALRSPDYTSPLVQHPSQAIAAQLNHRDENHQQHNHGEHDLRIETLIAVAVGNVTQAACADGARHG